MRLFLPLAAFALFVLAAYSPSPDSGGRADLAPADTSQWENLQVLPNTLTQDQLFGIMRNFTASLGVRCDHCHVQNENGQGMNFPSDANTHKEIARGMIRMVHDINGEDIPAIWAASGHSHGDTPQHAHGDEDDHGEDDDHADHHGDQNHGDHQQETAAANHHEMKVTCWTCHRGERIPSTTPPPRERN